MPSTVKEELSRNCNFREVPISLLKDTHLNLLSANFAVILIQPRFQNIYLLVLTFVTSIKNDIQFWNKKKSVEDLSVRSVFFNAFQKIIVVLYVFYNDTNTIIRISRLVGLAIELWKGTKVQDVSFNFDKKILGVIPRIKLDDKKDYADSGTKDFDRMAFGLSLIHI